MVDSKIICRTVKTLSTQDCAFSLTVHMGALPEILGRSRELEDSLSFTEQRPGPGGGGGQRVDESIVE